MHFRVRLQGDPETLVAAIHDAVWNVVPGLAVYDTPLITEISDHLVADDRLAASVAGIFALLGTALAGFGVYGLMAYFVGQRRVEIGTGGVAERNVAERP